MAEMAQSFNASMAEFRKDLQIASTSPSSNVSHIAAQFTAFRSFVLCALESLQAQIEAISGQYDQMEMRTRKKMLLIHGVPEDKGISGLVTVSQLLSKHLDIPDISDDTISRCQRFGRQDP